MLDRAAVVDAQFIQCVREQHFPPGRGKQDFAEAALSCAMARALFDSQLKSRLLDITARQLKEQGLSFYTIGSSGHEGNAVLGAVFPYTDMAFLHYRSGAFYIQRAKQREDSDGVMDILLSLVASANDPISGGRHKVFGSHRLNIPPQTSTIASHLPKALGAALSIQRARDLALQGPLARDSVVLASFGDASLNHASAQATLNSCAWIAAQGYPLPLVLVCEDNGIGISVPTPKNWVQESVACRVHLHYLQADGLNIIDLYEKAQLARQIAFKKRQPVFLHIKCVRLLGHAGSDIESQYLAAADIAATEAQDPLLHTARMLLSNGCLDSQQVIELYEGHRSLIAAKALQALKQPRMRSAEEVKAALIPAPRQEALPALPSIAQRQACFAETFAQLQRKRNLCQHINFALTDLLQQYPQLLVFGEDVGKKGGVYRVTADLQQRFGQRRVFDSLLDETTILGTAIGLAHNGFIPIPEIQFLAYLHNAEDQLRGEAATLSFFSSGQYQNPMVIRIAALAYQKGFGGHFHNDNSIAVLRDVPGVIVACPSNGPDAAKMLRTCVAMAWQQGRVLVFLEPIALYMTKDLHQAGDNAWLFPYPDPGECIEYGEVGVFGQGETVILTYANGYYLSRQAAELLEKEHRIRVKVVDLRWLSPLPETAILQQVKTARQVLIVDEGRKSGSLSEALMALLMEQGPRHLPVQRLCAEDCFIPLGDAWQYLLPSRDSIINAVLSLHASQQEKDSGRFITT
ncbi:MAG: MFS transporter [Legionellaceae bacterium]|nr:MFS transporter [Legionellaceae bacterium]